MVDSSPLHFDAAMTSRETHRCSTGTSSGAARSCGTASPQDIDAQRVDIPRLSAHLPRTPLRSAPCLPLWTAVCDSVGKIEVYPAKAP